MLYLIGIIITFFLAVLLLTKRNKSEADNILTTWLFLIGVHLSFYYLHYSGNHLEYPFLLGLELPLPFVHAPLLYLYTASLTNQSRHKKYRLLHFLPILFIYILFSSFLTSSNANKLYVYQNHGINYQIHLKVIYFVIIISGLCYIFLALLLIKKHKNNIVNNFSYTENITLNWLRYIIVGLILIWVMIIVGNDYLIFSAVVLYVIFIGYFGIKQVGIFTQTQSFDQNSNNKVLHFNKNGGKQQNLKQRDNEEAEELIRVDIKDQELNLEQDFIKYQKSSLIEPVIKEIHQKLVFIMQSEKLYKNPTLTLSELARRLDVQSNHLSQIINSIEKKNFFDYINSQRIEEFKAIVTFPENRKFTLLYLALECGFNSKTSFNRNFKKVTNLSPSEYLNKRNIELT